jgi:hypothetical protein
MHCQDLPELDRADCAHEMMKRARVAQQRYRYGHHDHCEKRAFTREGVWSFVFEVIVADMAERTRTSDAFRATTIDSVECDRGVIVIGLRELCSVRFHFLFFPSSIEMQFASRLDSKNFLGAAPYCNGRANRTWKVTSVWFRVSYAERV